ncbi:MAG: AAA family ATPase [Candidatus Paceibacterota bacterium]
MSLFNFYSGKQFLELELPAREWLVENVLREKDSCIFVGNEKSGKSLFIFQLICSLTTKHPFLDKFNVPKQSRVTYIQVEGELKDSQDRMKRMMKNIDFDQEYFQLKFSPPMELEQKAYMLGLCHAIKEHWIKNGNEKGKPDIVIIDPLYFCFMGSLNDDEVVRKFIGNIHIMKDILGCAVVIVHHTHKQKFDYTGGRIEEGDEALFGSKFLKAYPDHIILFDYDKERDMRIFSCTTQRSGQILPKCNLKLVSGKNTINDPLYFEEIEKEKIDMSTKIVNLLSKKEFNDGLDWEQITSMLHISKTSFFNSIKKPLSEGVIVKEGKPVAYKMKAMSGIDNLALDNPPCTHLQTSPLPSPVSVAKE